MPFVHLLFHYFNKNTYAHPSWTLSDVNSFTPTNRWPRWTHGIWWENLACQEPFLSDRFGILESLCCHLNTAILLHLIMATHILFKATWKTLTKGHFSGDNISTTTFPTDCLLFAQHESITGAFTASPTVSEPAELCIRTECIHAWFSGLSDRFAQYTGKYMNAQVFSNVPALRKSVS